MEKITQDKREIASLHYDDEDSSCHLSGQHGCEKIVAYEEKGPLDFVPYFAIYKDGVINQRIPAYKVSVVYK